MKLEIELLVLKKKFREYVANSSFFIIIIILATHFPVHKTCGVNRALTPTFVYKWRVNVLQKVLTEWNISNFDTITYLLNNA